MTEYLDEHMSPQRLAQVVTDRLHAEESPVAGYWHEVRGDRDKYAEDLRRLLVGAPVVVLVIREIVFDNPNAVQSEFVELIDKHRAEFEQLFSELPEYPPTVAVVLLARSVPAVPQVASPAIMPGWFPRFGGTIVPVYLRDLTWTGSAAIDCGESAIPQICAGLFTLDGALLRRLTSVHRAEPAEDFWVRVRFDDRFDFGDFLSASRRFRATVRNRQAFRPDARGGTTVVARLWKVAQRTSPEALNRIGTDLATALRLPEPLGRNWHQPFASVLGRPADRPPESGVAFASSVLRTVAASAQFITVAAHADDYDAYPVALLRSTSLDLLAAMRDATLVLQTLDSL
ncbi:hypothetical protein [Micromonospora sp. WMMD964]|uniref:hypothetical protein n=1 Tax=Micromonospora sp. WMMD964 TaxID=3016091 RepID=UPI00249A21CA|nr:hypothetical protein [Micromonospora sp. WMMD964]WFE98618.1 hypothetical protein O7616_17055 [Micromonospora sp. WMMD964]